MNKLGAMPGTTAWRSAWLTVALGLGACRETEEAVPDISSKYIDLYLDDGFEICGRQLAAYDRFIERVFSKWTQSDPGDFRVQVHVLDDADCNLDSLYTSCASSRKVQLGRPNAAFHELVHAVTLRTDGYTQSSIAEGIAEALGPGDPLVESSGLAPFEPAFIFTDRMSFAAIDYVPARFWTATLIERHGMEDFREYYRAMGQIDDPGVEDFERAFVNAFEEPLETAWASFLEEPSCVDPFQFCDMAEEIEIPYVVQDFECGGSPDAGLRRASGKFVSSVAHIQGDGVA